MTDTTRVFGRKWRRAARRRQVSPDPGSLMLPMLAGALLLALQDTDSLRLQIERRVAADSGAKVGIAYVDLGSSDTLFMNADSSFHAASTMKVPVMIELFRRAHSGSFRMDQGLLMVNQFASLA